MLAKIIVFFIGLYFGLTGQALSLNNSTPNTHKLFVLVLKLPSSGRWGVLPAFTQGVATGLN
jgi:hypothetical protein